MAPCAAMTSWQWSREAEASSSRSTVNEGWFSSSAQRKTRPDSLRVQIAAAGDPGVGLLVDEDAVLDLLGQPEHHAAVELPVFGIVSPVAVGLQFGLLGQMFRFGGGGLLRAGHAGGKPQMAPQMVPGAELLLGPAQLLGA